MDKLRVVLLFGGRSSEHSISCATAGGVLGAIDRDRFEVIPVGITRDGAFVLESDDPARFALDPAQLPEVVDNGTRVSWPESAVSRELRVTTASAEGGSDTRSLGDVDVVFPILHGRFGEDGTIQGLLELLGLPYVGNGVLASAAGMDKHATKTLLEGAGIQVAPWVTLTRAALDADPVLWQRRVQALGLPVFVKPARAGSSVGVTKVNDWSGLDAALDVAFAEDRSVLVESAVSGREIEIAVLEGPEPGEVGVSVAGEVIVSGRDFYDFEAKYLDAPGVELVCPADLGDGELFELQRVARRAFEALGAEGLARVDVFLTDEGYVVNEVNTMPGFTPISMFPTCWLNSGLSYPELITRLVEVGHARGAR
ncbi:MULTISPECIES: D-alanine--D-alanine ligase family protein [Agromyces]|uniref:D-alanine--D-alanine ligase family protein n=1 Tax=Agromyces TaxID=33877 RepID=UPI001E5E08B8|nr:MULTISPECIES: D-alanine--D-alanine ligase family protein [Agromyces]MCD1569968.1 D-alanine--D-alanine ligase [Agromyces mediolanus]GLU89760.1 D-alanine--D-alanine ligase [Agromyces sp. NBRC 114283]